MNVKTLIEKLKNFPEGHKVMIEFSHKTGNVLETIEIDLDESLKWIYENEEENTAVFDLRS